MRAFLSCTGCTCNSHCVSSLQLCVVCSLSVCVNTVWVIAEGCLLYVSVFEGECSGASSLLKEVAWQDWTDGLGEAISWDFPVVAVQIREALLSAIAYKNPPGADARGPSVFVCVVSVYVLCVCRYAGCQVSSPAMRKPVFWQGTNNWSSTQARELVELLFPAAAHFWSNIQIIYRSTKECCPQSGHSNVKMRSTPQNASRTSNMNSMPYSITFSVDLPFKIVQRAIRIQDKSLVVQAYDNQFQNTTMYMKCSHS